MTGYLPPVTARISDTWAGHRNRTPPSSEPGTDYASAIGTPCLAAANGRVYGLQTGPQAPTGRWVGVDLDDGRRVRYLHLATLTVTVGQRVTRGQQLGTTGGSANGSNHGVGAHVHVTLWERPGLPVGQTIDFQQHVGAPTPPTTEEDDTMALRMMHWNGGSVIDPTQTDTRLRRALFDSNSGYFSEFTESGSTFANNMARNWATGSSAEVTRSLANSILVACRAVATGTDPRI